MRVQRRQEGQQVDVMGVAQKQQLLILGSDRSSVAVIYVRIYGASARVSVRSQSAVRKRPGSLSNGTLAEKPFMIR